MKIQRILEQKDIAKIRKARDAVWAAHETFHKVERVDKLLTAKRLLDELLMEADG